MKSAAFWVGLSLASAWVGGAAADDAIRFQGEAREAAVCRSDGASCSQFKGYVFVDPARSGLTPPLQDAARAHPDFSAANAAGGADFRLRRLYLGADAP